MTVEVWGEIMKRELKIAIVDDQQNSRKTIYEKLKRLEQTLTNVQLNINMYESSTTFLAGKDYYDIVLLDYEMPEMNGINVAYELELRPEKTKIIFVTGYEKLTRIMQQATQLETVAGFILKQDDEKEFQFQIRNVINKLLNVYWIEIDYFSLDKDPEYDFANRQRSKRIHWKKLLDVRSIIYLQTTDKNVITMVTREGNFMMSKPLKDVIKQLPSLEFAYSERGTVINFRHILSVNKVDVLLVTNQKLLLTKKHFISFKKSYEEYLLGGFNKL